ncbi:MAG: MarC family protein, partial [Candidatus Competibacteraceae bacterium]|nr:MarC family protein [Candidatus Competibacteraceae bacterium]
MTLLLRDFVTLWVVVDPIGTIPVFLAATAGQTARMRRRVAVRAIIVAAMVL